MKIRSRRYVQPGLVKSLTSYFNVLKGDDGICIVYDWTKSGLNGMLWSAWFWFQPLSSTFAAWNQVLTWVTWTYWICFLIFYSNQLFNPMRGWTSLPTFQMMGLRPSPYQAIQAILHAEDHV
jgi:hypothetical protein